jgi:hypothetical protein
MSRILDEELDRQIDENPNQAIKWLLMASWLYYINDISILSDSRYDLLTTQVYNWWNDLTHMHKNVIHRDSLICGSLYYLKDEDYPSMIVSLACDYADIEHPPVIDRAQYDLSGKRIR